MTNTTQLRTTLSEAYADHKVGLLRYVQFRIKDPATCEDLLQETYLKTWKYLVKNGSIDLIKPFLYHVLNHLIIDEYRKRKSISLDVLMESGFDLPNRHDSAETAMTACDSKGTIDLIQALPLTYQQVMKLRYVDGLSLSEIAKETGQTKNSIAVKAHRGMDKLQSLYQDSSLYVMARTTNTVR